MIPFHPSVTLLSRALLGFFFIRVLRLYLAHFWNSFSSGCYVSISRNFRISFYRVLRQYLTHFQSSSSSDCYVTVSRTFRIPFQPSVTLVSRALLGFLFIRVLRSYLVHFQDFCSSDCYISVSNTFRILFIQLLRMYLDCYVSISRTFRNFLHSIVILIVTLVCQELLRFSSIRLLRQCLACFQNSLAFNYHICIPNVTLVSRTFFRFFSIRLIR